MRVKYHASAMAECLSLFAGPDITTYRLSGNAPDYGGIHNKDVIIIQEVKPKSKQTVIILVDKKWVLITKCYTRGQYMYFRPLRQLDFDDDVPHRVFRLPGDDIQVIGVLRGLFRKYN